MDSSEIKRRLNILKSDRSSIESVWDRVEQFCVPFRGDFYKDESNENSIDWRTRQVYDSTAIMGVQTLASSIHGSLTSPSFRWFDLRFRDEDLNTRQIAKAWLEECATRIYFAIQESNFNLEVNESYTDLASFGNSMVIEEIDGDEFDENSELVFATMPLKECYFEEDHKGRIVNFYRELDWTPIQIREKFGEDNIPPMIREMCDNPSMVSKKMCVIFCIYKVKGNDVRPDTITTPENRPYQYRYILEKCGTELGRGGYYEMPVFVPRWRRTTQSKWGHSPAMIALADILTANQLVELTLRSLEKVVDPATLVTERGLLSDLDLGAGGMTVVRTLDDIRTHESRARFDVAELHLDKLRGSIRSAFYVDQLELKESPAMTATEVQVRYELMQRLLGPTLGRLQSDFLSPMIERTFFIMYRAGKLPPLPEGIEATDLDIQYTGPLTSAQKVDQAAKVERWISDLNMIAQVNPEVLDIFDADAAGRGMADILNVPARYVRAQEQVAAVRKQRQQQQNVQQQLMMAQQAGEAGQALGKAAKEMGNG